MSICQRLRLTLFALTGALSVISFGAAMQFWEIAAELTMDGGRNTAQSVEWLGAQSTTAAIGLALTGTIALAIAAAVLHSVQTAFLHRLAALDEAALDVALGDEARRATVDGDDELARIARVLNFALDSRDRVDAEMHGRNRDIRALLVALLRRGPSAAAITSFDGTVLASTLSNEEEAQLRSLTPQLREAAGVLLARGFATATEFETDVRFANGLVFHIRALALDDQRLSAGWESAEGARRGITRRPSDR